MDFFINLKIVEIICTFFEIYLLLIQFIHYFMVSAN